MAAVQLWLSLASPLVAAAVEVLRPRGFFLGGALPRWFDEDALLLQRVQGTPSWGDMHILPGTNQVVFDLVRQDWQRLEDEKTPALRRDH